MLKLVLIYAVRRVLRFIHLTLETKRLIGKMVFLFPLLVHLPQSLREIVVFFVLPLFELLITDLFLLEFVRCRRRLTKLIHSSVPNNFDRKYIFFILPCVIVQEIRMLLLGVRPGLLVVGHLAWSINDG